MNVIDAPPYAIFRVLIRWGRFVFEPHAAPSSAQLRSEGQQHASGGGGADGHASAVETQSSTEYRVVWFRAIDGVAIGHTKWCALSILHSVVSVVDFQNAPAVVDIAAGYMANPATRVILLQLQQRIIDPSVVASSNGGAQHVASRPVVAATGAVDIGMFVGSPPRSYIVTLEASFFAVGKLHMNLVVKEPKIDDAMGGGADPSGVGGAAGAGGGGAPGAATTKSMERLTVLIIDSMEQERADGGGAGKVGVYGLARLLQDKGGDDKHFPLPHNSAYQLKVSFVMDPRYVAKPQLVRSTLSSGSGNGAGGGGGGKTDLSQSRAPPRDTRPSSATPSAAAAAGGGAMAGPADHGGGGGDAHMNNNNNSFGIDHGGRPAELVGDVVEDDDETYRGSRKVTSFRTLLRNPHDGRVLWRCGIALTPCTKIKFALYREHTKIATTAIMASQLTVAAMPHDFALPMRVRSVNEATGQRSSVAMQINVTLSEHTLDTISGEVIASQMDSSNKAATGHVAMLPGTDLMVMLRGYETTSGRDASSMAFAGDAAGSSGAYDEYDDEYDNNSYEYGSDDGVGAGARQSSAFSPDSHIASTTRTEPGSARMRSQQQQQQQAAGGGGGGGGRLGGALNNRNSNEPTTFAEVAPVVIPSEFRERMQKEAFVTQSADTDVMRADNNRLAEENAQLRVALTEQEERIRDQENYILALLEMQGVVAVDDGEGGVELMEIDAAGGGAGGLVAQ